MERRCNLRRPLDLSVFIHGRNGSVRGRAVNFSGEGMFVALSSPAPLSGAVEVMVTVPGSANRTPYRLPALVVHARPEGVGLMFCRAEGDVARLLAVSHRSARVG